MVTASRLRYAILALLAGIPASIFLAFSGEIIVGLALISILVITTSLYLAFAPPRQQPHSTA